MGLFVIVAVVVTVLNIGIQNALELHEMTDNVIIWLIWSKINLSFGYCGH
jgi:hypothetical protein